MARRGVFAILLLILIAAYPAAYPDVTRSGKQVNPERKSGAPAPAKRIQPAGLGERGIAQRWLRGLTLRDKIAQLVITTSYGEAPSSRSAAYRDYVRAV